VDRAARLGTPPRPTMRHLVLIAAGELAETERSPDLLPVAPPIRTRRTPRRVSAATDARAKRPVRARAVKTATTVTGTRQLGGGSRIATSESGEFGVPLLLSRRRGRRPRRCRRWRPRLSRVASSAANPGYPRSSVAGSRGQVVGTGAGRRRRLARSGCPGQPGCRYRTVPSTAARTVRSSLHAQ
jgi:hypothetical protein